MQLQRPLHDRPDGVAGGEGVEGILEHRLHQAVELLRVGFQQLLGGNAVKVDLAAGGFLQPDQQPAQCGLAAAAFADNAEDFPLLQREGHAVHRVHLFGLAEQAAALLRIQPGQAPHLQHRLGGIEQLGKILMLGHLFRLPFLTAMAGRKMARLIFPNLRPLLTTALRCIGAAGRENAACGRVGQIR